MNIISVYKQFPTQASCIKHLEHVRWNERPVCPYCQSTNQSPLPKENRYHCNTCNTTFSVTVGTIFHKTKMDLQKWFLAIALTLNAKKGISARQLARDIEVTKDTAWRILMQIRKSFVDDCELLEGIIEIDETFVGGKNKNRHADKKVEGGQGGNGGDKTIVVGTLERGGKVKAQKVIDRSAKTLHGVVKQNVAKGSQLMTDEFKSYNGLCLLYGHQVVNHAMKEYVNGACHTNTLEGFWSLLKRGVIGQYHYVSPRYLNNYINEFCYRYNSRKTNINEVFAAVISKGLSIR
ncbi:MAG: IS1595 family transposase [Taibaiella sp.]|nr:IS1595 family transposase [Taibaiella sp.]